MARKIILLADPGIDGAFAIALALFDPQIDVLALAATAGNIPADIATNNVHILIEHFDPPKWPRLGAALPVENSIDGTDLHGKGGLGGLEYPSARLHHPHYSDKLIVDQVRLFPGEVTIVTMGPLTALAAAIDRDKELPKLVRQLIILGGSWREPGNATAVAEFHFFCDPLAARQVLRCGAAITLIPLDAMRKALFSPAELARIPGSGSITSELLKKIVPYGIGATARKYGIEGFYLEDILGVCALSIPEAFKTKSMTVDVETQGELTRGMTVFDERLGREASNVDLVIDVDMKAVRNYMGQVFRSLSDEEE